MACDCRFISRSDCRWKSSTDHSDRAFQLTEIEEGMGELPEKIRHFSNNHHWINMLETHKELAKEIIRLTKKKCGTRYGKHWKCDLLSGQCA